MASVLAKAKQLLTPAASWYGQQLTQRPIVTKSITSCVLFMVGDGMAQSIEGKGMDVARLARMGIWGGMFGVMAHGWFGMLEKLVTSTGNWGAFYRVLWDQLTWTPVVNVVFFVVGGILRTGNPAVGFAEAQDKLWAVLPVNWTVWPIIQAVNFTVVPLQYRVLFVNVASIFWAAFLSSVLNEQVPDAPSVVPTGEGAAPALRGGLQEAR